MKDNKKSPVKNPKTTSNDNPKKQGDERKPKVSRGLYQKPLRNKGTLIGSRELTTGIETQSTLTIPKQEKGAIRVLFFGGLGEIGKNMYGIEYENDIIILDCGMKFSESDTLGVDFLVPNIQYLEERKEKVRGIIISHAHLDHIGGISVLIDKLGNPPVFSRKLSIELIRNRQVEFKSNKPIVYHEVEKNSEIKITKDLTLTFFSVTHTIPDSMGIIIDTPIGTIVFTGDLKLRHIDGVVDEDEKREFEVFKKKNVLLTMADSTNADRPGFSLPESRVIETIQKIIQETRGRIILSSFSSQIERSIKIIECAINDGRKIIVQGRSMITNLTIASELGLLKVPTNAIIPADKIDNYPKEKILVLATGAQGDSFTALDRMSREQHRYIKLGKNDTVVFSSSVIPGNEEPIQNLKDRLSRLGVNLITYQTSDVHSSGHANKGELKWIHEHINAKFFIPIHGYHYMLVTHAQILHKIGMPKENTVISENGSIVDISPDGKNIIQQEYTMPTKVNVVDGNAIGAVQEVVLKDRKTLESNGILVVILLINPKTKSVKKSPDIISRGFVYLKESKQLINKARFVARKSAERSMRQGGTLNIELMKRNINRDMQNFLYFETKKRPIIIPVLYIN